MNELISRWNDNECPMLNGVMLTNGMYYPVKPVDAPRKPLPMHLTYGECRMLPEISALGWASLIQTCEVKISGGNLKVIAGEGSMGADGFVALSAEDQSLRWVAFFDFSNPFERLYFDDANVIIAENNLGEAWRLSVSCPWEIIVTTAAPRI
ncbi:MAG: hypothetical protein ABI273_14150 [Lacunisphaera sp.]